MNPFNPPKLTPRKRNDPMLHVKTPACPLCHEPMKRESRPARGIYVFCCHGVNCEISIWVGDDFVGRWDEALKDEKILCPNPRCPKAPFEEMRYFSTRVGYMKALCPPTDGGCGAKLTNAEPDRKTDTPDKIYTPENKGTLQ